MRCAILFVALTAAAMVIHAGTYTESMFRKALDNESTSPDYVLIEIRGAADETNRTVCTTANLFLGAIHQEYDLAYTEADEKRARDIALNQEKRCFTFHKKKAIHNLVDNETPQALADVRKQLVGKMDSELLDGEFIYSIINKVPRSKYSIYRDAVAHALLERGIGCRMGDIPDGLFPHL